LIQKDLLKRKLFKKDELQRLILKSMIKNSVISDETKTFAVGHLFRMSKNGSRTRIRNRCVLTGRGRSIHRRFKLSRITFRELASKGLLNGIYKSTW
jgi:small subunit ribosomal protein S14